MNARRRLEEYGGQNLVYAGWIDDLGASGSRKILEMVQKHFRPYARTLESQLEDPFRRWEKDGAFAGLRSTMGGHQSRGKRSSFSLESRVLFLALDQYR